MDESYRQVLEEHMRAGRHPVRAAVLLMVLAAVLAAIFGPTGPEHWLEMMLLENQPFRE